jgi:hypothetical protein
MEQALFSQNVMGLVSSITTPLLSSLILIDGLISDDIDSVEDYEKILLVEEQIQSSIEYFLELRTLTLNKLTTDIFNIKSKDNKYENKINKEYHKRNSIINNYSENRLINKYENKKWWKKYSSGILIVVNIVIFIWQTYKMIPI